MLIKYITSHRNYSYCFCTRVCVSAIFYKNAFKLAFWSHFLQSAIIWSPTNMISSFNSERYKKSKCNETFETVSCHKSFLGLVYRGSDNSTLCKVQPICNPCVLIFSPVVFQWIWILMLSFSFLCSMLMLKCWLRCRQKIWGRRALQVRQTRWLWALYSFHSLKLHCAKCN